jgi:hypothetical protein
MKNMLVCLCIVITALLFCGTVGALNVIDSIDSNSEIDHWIFNMDASSDLTVDVLSYEGCGTSSCHRFGSQDYFGDGSFNNRLVSNVHVFKTDGTLVGSNDGPLPGNDPGPGCERFMRNLHLELIGLDPGDYILAIGAHPLSVNDAWWGGVNSDGSSWTNEPGLFNKYDMTLSSMGANLVLQYGLGVTTEGWGNVVPDPPASSFQPRPGEHVYLCDENANVELTASPDANWAFTGWSGDLSGSTNPETLTMDANKNVTAIFQGLKDYDLFLNVTGSGTVTVDPNGGTYDAGTVVTLTAESSGPYWVFSEWGGDLSGEMNPETVTMDADKNITAIFSDDSDGDGISDGDEDAGPNGGDANNDGTPDREQPEVVSIKTYDNQHYVWLEVESPPGATLTGCQTLAPPGCGDWVEFPYGFFEFTIEGVGAGGAAIVSLHLPAGGVQDTYYKFGPRPGFPDNECYNFMFEPTTQTGAEINGDVTTLYFIDGLRGDDDLSENGTIVDQGGPGVMFAEETLIGPTGGQGGTTGGGSSSAIGGCFVGTVGSDLGW